jgi:hypothetical protein
MGKTWWELSLEIGLTQAVNEYVAVNGDITIKDLMDIFYVNKYTAIWLIKSLQY